MAFSVSVSKRLPMTLATFKVSCWDGVSKSMRLVTTLCTVSATENDASSCSVAFTLHSPVSIRINPRSRNA